MADPQEFFTPSTIEQISGAIAAVTAVPVAFRSLTGINTPIVPFVTSIILTYVAAGTSGILIPIHLSNFPKADFFHEIQGWIIPLINGCLLFTAVIGATESGGAVERKVVRAGDNTRSPSDRLSELNDSFNILEQISDSMSAVGSERFLNYVLRISERAQLFRSWFE